MINNTADYVSLLRDRAAGSLPDMGSALRVSALIQAAKRRRFGKDAVEILDVGCGAGHYYRTFMRENLAISKYVGLEIDPAMVQAARDVWASELTSGAVDFIVQDLESSDLKDKFDFVICMNAFMYFSSARRALANLLSATRHNLIIRSYFTDSNYRIIRAQTKQNHDKATLDEMDAFDEDGNILCFDFWNIYSYSYIEALVRRLSPHATLEWLEDENPLDSLEQERNLNIQNRGAKRVLEGYEVSYPFILPWKYLSITVDSSHSTDFDATI